MNEPSANVRKVRANLVEAALRALVRCGEDLLGRASRDAPLEEGTLRASGALVVIVNGTRYEGAGSLDVAIAAARAAAIAGRPAKCEVEVSFNTIYAAAQHEGISFEHPLAGKAKYLEHPLVENAGRYGRLIKLAAAQGAKL